MRRTETPEGRSVRLLRVGEQVRHVLSELLARGEVHDDVLQSHLVSVTEVRMSPDLRHATVFVKPLLGQDEESVLTGPACRRAACCNSSRFCSRTKCCRASASSNGVGPTR